MRTRPTIMAIVLAAAAGPVGVVVLLVVMVGWFGLAIGGLGTITVAAAPEGVWPWLVQLGYGRGGWYSYDWIDNDGHPSADRIIPQLQRLEVGDQIQMLPAMGPRIREIEPNRHFVAGDQEAGVWCLALYPTPGGCRLVSRWRVDWPLTPATAFWILLSDPGACCRVAAPSLTWTARR